MNDIETQLKRPSSNKYFYSVTLDVHVEEQKGVVTWTRDRLALRAAERRTKKWVGTSMRALGRRIQGLVNRGRKGGDEENSEMGGEHAVIGASEHYVLGEKRQLTHGKLCS